MFDYLIGFLYTVVIMFLLCLLQVPKRVSVTINKRKSMPEVNEVKKVEEEKYDPLADVIQGELYKLGSNEMFRSWKLRTFKLVGSKLVYFDENSKKMGEFDITSCAV